MKNFLYFILFIFISLITPYYSNDIILVDDSSNNVDKVEEKFEVIDEEFIPTHEWQKVKPGQAIPKGLHVRLNVQTGEREAKILEEEKPTISKEFEESLKRIDNEQMMPEKTPQEMAHEEEVRKKFKSYDELKKELNDLNLNVQTDFEIIKSLIDKFKNSTRDDKLAILKDLEFYVHQFDNGLLLCDLGGFDLLLSQLNSTLLNEDSEFAQNLILVLGSAIQSNSKVKVHAIKTQLLQIILNRISSRALTDELYSKFVFVLSGLLRNFPFAQNQFLKLGGVEILSNLVRKINTIKLKTKILTLMDDLVREKATILNVSQSDENTINQYAKINLIEELIEKKWCGHYSELLESADDHDSREKIIDSIITLNKHCQNNFSDVKFINLINKLLNDYEILAKSDSEDEYFSKLVKNLQTILNEINLYKTKQDL